MKIIKINNEKKMLIKNQDKNYNLSNINNKHFLYMIIKIKRFYGIQMLIEDRQIWNPR